MSEQEVRQSQKTVISFIAGLLVGGLLVWMFGGEPKQAEAPAHTAVTEDAASTDTPSEEMTSEREATNNEVKKNDTTPAKKMEVGDAKVELSSKAAGDSLAFSSATFPTDAGWVAVRSYENETLGSVLGASRYSKEQGLVPERVYLLAPTVKGKTYAVTFFSENGDNEFNMRSDFQLETEPIVFVAE